jgi:hypothetical protein
MFSRLSAAAWKLIGAAVDLSATRMLTPLVGGVPKVARRCCESGPHATFRRRSSSEQGGRLWALSGAGWRGPLSSSSAVP